MVKYYYMSTVANADGQHFQILNGTLTKAQAQEKALADPRTITAPGENSTSELPTFTFFDSKQLYNIDADVIYTFARKIVQSRNARFQIIDNGVTKTLDVPYKVFADFPNTTVDPNNPNKIGRAHV